MATYMVWRQFVIDPRLYRYVLVAQLKLSLHFWARCIDFGFRVHGLDMCLVDLKDHLKWNMKKAIALKNDWHGVDTVCLNLTAEYGMLSHALASYARQNNVLYKAEWVSWAATAIDCLNIASLQVSRLTRSCRELIRLCMNCTPKKPNYVALITASSQANDGASWFHWWIWHQQMDHEYAWWTEGWWVEIEMKVQRA